MHAIPKKTVLKVALIAEGAIILLSMLWSNLRQIQLPLDFTSQNLLMGVKASGPIIAFNFGIFAVLANRNVKYNVYRTFRDQVVMPICAKLDVPSALAISLLSGTAEELFFRGVLLLELEPICGITFACVISSAIFAYVHFIGMVRHYLPLLIFYFLFGLYFAYVSLKTGNLVPVMTSHALYNFIAILYMRYKPKI